MRLRVLASLLATLLLIPMTTAAQTIQTEDGQILELTRVANPAAAAMQDLSDDYGMINYENQRNLDSPRSDYLVAYQRFDDVPTMGPLFIEMRMVVFSGAQPQSVIDDAFADYLRIGAPDLLVVDAPRGFERYRWFSVDDTVQGLFGFATLFSLENGFASIAALGQEGDFTIDDVATIAQAAAARLGA